MGQRLVAIGALLVEAVFEQMSPLIFGSEAYTMAIIHTMDHALCVTVQLAASRTPSWGCFKKKYV